MNFSPFFWKKVYYFASTASLFLIGWAVVHFGETNLPPLLPAVRRLILILYANWFLGYILFVSDAEIQKEKITGWAWIVPIGILLSLIHPVFSGDLMEYLIRGRMLGVYHVSPYRFVPQDFPQDPLRPYSVWTTNPDSYGALSVYLQTLPVLLFPKSIPGMIWAYKMMVLAFLGAAVIFFKKITELADPAAGARLWAVFAYCPLLIVTALIDGHNDTIMMAFSVISIYYLMKDKFGLSFFFWTCGFLVKYMIFLQLPFMGIYAVRRRWTAGKKFPWLFILSQPLFNLLLIAACFAPVWGGEGTLLAILRQKGAFYTNTIPYLFYLALQFFKLPVSTAFVKTFFLALFAFFYLYLLLRAWRKAGGVSVEFFRIVALAYLGFYAALPSPLGYWYLLWAVFWIVLARWPNSLTLVVLYSLVGVLSFYKRPNFLAAIAVILYLLSLAAAPLLKIVFRKRIYS